MKSNPFHVSLPKLDMLERITPQRLDPGKPTPYEPDFH
jgi:hypothetical protein